MDKVAKVDNQERAILFQETSTRTGIQPGLVEKDFWVCWTLQHLFSIPEFDSRLLFKGGTTLSKIFGVIQRFSEDIDMAVDYVALGFTGDRDPLAPMSNTKRTKLLDEMLAP
ncbi:MAG: nucleotidyl transferase AbiEii/AbiGii toxin family protein [Verrucomicrobia bacterium]|jgi:predicted nucleotidyltransferase component of viral defense system|nr:nucleotidyl transferase AbiEii/AbiGii toxin family protein [Verrucomicrobiota bacterium]